MENKKIALLENRKMYSGLLLVIFTAILFFITIHKLETNKRKMKNFSDLL